MVNATDFSAGPFAPNSVVTIFGSNLTFSADPASAPSGATLPTQLAGIAVYVDNSAAPLLYASDTQINFLIPSDEISGSVQIQVVRQSWAGPSIAVVLTAAAPCLFSTANQYVLAADWNAAGALVTPGAPAHAGDTVVLYATGLGYTQPNLNPGAVPATAAEIQNPASFSLLLNGSPIDPSLVKYVGLTPGWPGLYQINFIVPPNWTADDPQIQISVANQTSAAGLLLAVRAAGETLTAGNTLNR
jgi:adhesin/invasin